MKSFVGQHEAEVRAELTFHPDGTFSVRMGREGIGAALLALSSGVVRGGLEGHPKSPVRLTDDQIDCAFALESGSYDGLTLPVKERMRIHARNLEEAFLRANDLLPREGENHG